MYRAYDLDPSRTEINNLYNTFSGTYTITTAIIKDLTLYIGD